MTRKQVFYNNLKTYLPALIVLLLFFILTIPGNTSDADDAYTFARLIRDEPLISLFLPRYPLYLPVSKAVFTVFSFSGMPIDAHDFLIYQSLVAGAFTVLLFHWLCWRNLGFTKNMSWLMAAFLLFSFAFWRYSVQAEVYTLSLFLLLLFIIQIFGFLQRKTSGGRRLMLIITGVCCILLYKPNIIPVLLILPWLALWQNDRWQPLYLLLMTASGVVVIYGILGMISTDFGFTDYLFGGATRTQGNVLAALAVIFSNIVSMLWVFSVDWLENIIRFTWPGKVIEEEVYIAATMSFSGWVVAILFSLLAVSFLLLLVSRKQVVSEVFRKRWWQFMVAWVVIYGAMLLYFDPASSEPWIMLQVPLVLIFGGILFPSEGKSRNLTLSVIFLVLLFCVNLFGGMLLLRDKAYDYIYQRARTALETGNGEDIILTFGPKNMEEYLRYNSQARVLNLEESFEEGIGLLSSGFKDGDILVLEDVLHPDPAIRYRMENEVERAGTIIFNNYQLDTLDTRENFRVYKLIKK